MRKRHRLSPSPTPPPPPWVEIYWKEIFPEEILMYIWGFLDIQYAALPLKEVCRRFRNVLGDFPEGDDHRCVHRDVGVPIVPEETDDSFYTLGFGSYGGNFLLHCVTHGYADLLCRYFSGHTPSPELKRALSLMVDFTVGPSSVEVLEWLFSHMSTDVSAKQVHKMVEKGELGMLDCVIKRGSVVLSYGISGLHGAIFARGLGKLEFIAESALIHDSLAVWRKAWGDIVAHVQKRTNVEVSSTALTLLNAALSSNISSAIKSIVEAAKEWGLRWPRSAYMHIWKALELENLEDFKLIAQLHVDTGSKLTTAERIDLATRALRSGRVDRHIWFATQFDEYFPPPTCDLIPKIISCGTVSIRNFELMLEHWSELTDHLRMCSHSSIHPRTAKSVCIHQHDPEILRLFYEKHRCFDISVPELVAMRRHWGDRLPPDLDALIQERARQ